MIFFRYLILLVFCTLISACASFSGKLQAPSVSLVNIKPVKIGLNRQHFRCRLRVKNPNSVELPIRSIRYKLQLNNHDFAEGVSDRQITLPANGEIQFEIDAAARLSKLLRNLGAIGRGKITYKIQGEVELVQPSISKPFVYQGDIEF